MERTLSPLSALSLLLVSCDRESESRIWWPVSPSLTERDHLKIPVMGLGFFYYLFITSRIDLPFMVFNVSF